MRTLLHLVQRIHGGAQDREVLRQIVTAKIEELQKSVINAINNSCLHPAVVRLVLLNVISMVEASEREVNKKEEEATR